MLRVLALLILLSSSALAQKRVAVMRPDGTYTAYIQAPKVIRIVKRDTVRDTTRLIFVVHDTLRWVATYVQREVVQPITVAVQVGSADRSNAYSQFGVLGLSTYRFNLIGPSYSFSLGPVRFFLVLGASYLADESQNSRKVVANAGVVAYAGF